MLPVLGVAASALDALQSLTSSKSSSPVTGFGQGPASPFDIANSSTPSASTAPVSGTSGFSQISPPTMSALLEAQGQSSTAVTSPTSSSRSSALQDLFSLINADGNGS